MGQNKRRLPSGTQGQLLRPQHESDRVLQALVTMATRIGRPFSEARMQQLHDDLGSYPVEAIEWAIDCWSRNAKVLPALADLLQLLKTWHVTSSEEETDRSQFGTGYDGNDIVWLNKKICAIRSAFGRKPTAGEYVAMFQELDKTRKGGTPAHFRTAFAGGMPEDWIVEAAQR